MLPLANQHLVMYIKLYKWLLMMQRVEALLKFNLIFMKKAFTLSKTMI